MHKSLILVVGAGLSGAVIARELANDGHLVDVIESRDHVAGNAYDYVNEHGIVVHKYGPHIFHTNNKTVVDWLSDFTEWVEYKHKVKAVLSDGRYVTLPVNKETSEIVGADKVIDTFIRPYTKKMWGLEIEQLDPEILSRVPIRDDMNELYFPNDEFQFMPKNGYTKMVEKILDHPNISVVTKCPFVKGMENAYHHTFNSMPIDVYFDNVHGQLPYRSIKFHNVDVPSPKLLPTACVNFTHSGKFTRMTEWKNFPGHNTLGNDHMTTLTYEEPCDYNDNNQERYYPVKDMDGKNRETFNKYKSLVNDNMTFIGRCGMYAYLDMHQAVSTALSIAKKFRE